MPRSRSILPQWPRRADAAPATWCGRPAGLPVQQTDEAAVVRRHLQIRAGLVRAPCRCPRPGHPPAPGFTGSRWRRITSGAAERTAARAPRPSGEGRRYLAPHWGGAGRQRSPDRAVQRRRPLACAGADLAEEPSFRATLLSTWPVAAGGSRPAGAAHRQRLQRSISCAGCSAAR